ncbi:hypothetical protein NBRC10512_002506 [Rhodotorula toruloides]|uniref:RHTO0S35e00276g1_1 n=2 Tax=Rhodotorula toruloides TaxID=5286 RepID=A0A061BP72_RHOTO|nr:uncharacterized protein RHTO_01326 [Rhodotorula toruloides NP11]EMS21679.1 hypothetical protein RHTO_01326 [Rhodotorula toruloides NP11]CDR49824.1 RHTO0S35e00276g1_1 [Rhodotorula toruloides]
MHQRDCFGLASYASLSPDTKCSRNGLTQTDYVQDQAFVLLSTLGAFVPKATAATCHTALAYPIAMSGVVPIQPLSPRSLIFNRAPNLRLHNHISPPVASHPRPLVLSSFVFERFVRSHMMLVLADLSLPRM